MAEEDEITTADEDKKLSPFSRVGTLTKILMAVMVISMWYVVSSTETVPNKTYTNYTNPLTNTTIIVPHFKYNETSDVPSGSVTATYALFQTLLAAIIIVLILNGDVKPPDYITINEAIKIAQKHIKIWQEQNILPRGEILVTSFHKLKYIQYGSEKIPFKYVIDMRILLPTGLTKFYRMSVNAKSKFVIENTPDTKPLDREDLCANCGKDCDVKVLTGDTLRDFATVKRLLKGGGA